MKKTNLSILALFLSFFSFFITRAHGVECDKEEFITIAILAKDKAHALPLYLECLESQTWPKKKTYLYIRTNNNTDNTQQILKEWTAKVKDQYGAIYFDDKNVEERVQDFKQHDWNAMRFKVLGKIRQDSIEWAKEHNSHYFVVDCDNFIYPHTLSTLFDTHLPIVAPFLKLSNYNYYSNFHASVDQEGYLKEDNLYYEIYNQTVKGLIQVDVVHCTYFIRKEVLDKMRYGDETSRHEYVIFSDTARKNHIPQYFDNREVYGRISFAENKEELLKEHWLPEFVNLKAGSQLILQEHKADN